MPDYRIFHVFLSLGGQCIWRRRGRRSSGWVDSSVWRICMEARGGCPFPPQGHWRVAVGNGGAVRPSNPRSNGSSRHVEPQPAQPVEGHGGHLYEAQREPGRQPRLHSPTHRVLTLAFPTASVTSHFPSLSPAVLSPPLLYLYRSDTSSSLSSLFFLIFLSINSSISL